MNSTVEQLIRQYTEHEKNGGKAWNTLFQNITINNNKQVKAKKLTFKIAYSIENVEKNRYRDISPYDQNRITLGSEENYINASPVPVEETGQKYILCQGPLDETCSDFWQMIWENNVQTIVMLNRLIERGQLKCSPYYPNSMVKDKITFASPVLGPFKIDCESMDEQEDYTIRNLIVSQEGQTEVKKVVHLQYTEWPDFGVPRTPSDFLHFLEKYWEIHGMDNTNTPSVVHCSAGVGRSGTFVLVDTVIRMAKRGMKVDIEKLICRLREKRMGLIQTPQQLRFSWYSIVAYFESQYGASSSLNLNNTEDMEIKGIVDRKRESVDDDMRKDMDEGEGEGNETLAKRRQLIALMVARSRAAEASISSSSISISTVLPSSSMAITSIGVVVIAGILYYYTR